MKKFISLFLVVSVLTLSIPLTAKERRGADLIVQKTDGTQVRGELIAVKQTSLLLLERDSGADVTVEIEDIRVITIVKKSRTGKFALLIGASLGLIGSITSIWDEEYGFVEPFVMGAIFGALIGVIVGAIAGIDKTIQIEGKSDSEIQEILEKLYKKARVRNAR